MSSYAYYRLPRANSYTRITQLKGEPEQLLSLTALNGREGFVVAPFAVSEAEPILLIRADEVVTCEELGVRRGGDYKSPSTERGEKTQHLEKVDQDYLLDFLNFFFGHWSRLGTVADEAGNTRGVADDVPSFI